VVTRFRVLCCPVSGMCCHLAQDFCRRLLTCKAARANFLSPLGRLGWKVLLCLLSRPSLRAHAFTSRDMSHACLRHHVLLPSAHNPVPSMCAVRTHTQAFTKAVSASAYELAWSHAASLCFMCVRVCVCVCVCVGGWVCVCLVQITNSRRPWGGR